MTLQEMKNVNPAMVDRSTLADIADVKIAPSLPREEQIRAYLRQIKNPYVFLCSGVVVKVSFAETSATIEDKLEEYIRQRQKNHSR